MAIKTFDTSSPVSTSNSSSGSSNGLVIGLFLLVAAYFGYKYWDKKKAEEEAASKK